MTRPVRATSSVLLLVLGSLAVSIGLALGAAAPAQAACARPTADVAKLVQRADVVFVGTIEAVEGQSMDWTYDVTATRVHKGAVERSVQVRSQGECELGEIAVGTQYVFFARGDASPYRANLSDGTGPARTSRLEKVEQELGPGEVVEPPPPPKATYTPADTSEPAGFARVAAPGAAAVIIGALGLLVVRRLAGR